MSRPNASILLALALMPAVALASPGSEPEGRGAGRERGTVLSIDGGRIYVDLGTEDGLAEGSDLRLYHVVAARHPTTGKLVRDQFPLGTLEVTVAGRTLAVALAPAAFAPRVAVGDRVGLISPPIAHVDPWSEPAPTAPIDPYAPSDLARVVSAQGRVAADQAAAAAWKATRAVSRAERIALWKRFLVDQPRSRHAGAAAAEIEILRREMADEAAASGTTGEVMAARRAGKRLRGMGGSIRAGGPLLFSAPVRAYEGSRVPLGFFVADPSVVEQAWVYYRRAGATTYERAPLRSGGDGTLLGELPAHAVTAPGVEYFVETRAGGAAEPAPALGTQATPLRLEVDRSVEPRRPDITDRSRVTMFFDLVDFDGVSGEWDQYLHGEIDFMYRFYRPIYSLRLGFGTMSGTGGPKDVIDGDPTDECMRDGQFMCRKVGYNFGYAEVELRLGELVAVMARPQWGSAYNDRSPADVGEREFFDAFGMRGRLRLGTEMGSNLVLGASATRGLGKLFEGAFTWDVIPRWPVVLSVQVTDQPVIEDYGVRLIADVGWRGIAWMVPSLRMAYQARDIDHAGASLGAGVHFDW